MRVRLERYETANRSVQTRSLLAFVFGGIGLAFFGFIAFLGLLMIAFPSGEGGGLYEHRTGMFLGFFVGGIPMGISALIIAWGVRQRARFRRYGELAAVARQTPMLTTPQLAHALRLSPFEAERLVVEASSIGLIEADAISPIGTASTISAPHPGGSTPPPHHPHHAGSGHHVASAPPLSGPPGSIGFGTVLGDVYRIEEPLGAGGMGAVHAARHLRTGRRYALKTILAGANANEDTIRRFEREATAASALGHPGIVQVHDFNVAPNGLFYLVMDLLEGETLGARLARSSPLAWPDAQRIAVDLCSALAAAHEHGLLHRDIKPSNIFLAKADRTVLVDFGLVKSMGAADSASQVTSTGAVVGTPMYMSPEQARGEHLDVRSDLYSLAAVVFESVTGSPPYLDRTLASVYARLLNDPPPRASQVASQVARKGLPRALDEVLVRALAKDRAARYPTARALGEALAAVSEEAPGAEVPATERMISG